MFSLDDFVRGQFEHCVVIKSSVISTEWIIIFVINYNVCLNRVFERLGCRQRLRVKGYFFKLVTFDFKEMKGGHDVVNSNKKGSALINADFVGLGMYHHDAYLTDSPVRMHLIVRNHFSTVHSKLTLVSKVFWLFLFTQFFLSLLFSFWRRCVSHLLSKS